MVAGIEREALWPWLGRWLPDTTADEKAYETLDLEAYANASNAIGGTDAERLRLLAVFLEEERAIASWTALGRIYAAAHGRDPLDANVQASRALAGMWCQEVKAHSGPSDWEEAIESARSATKLAPTDPHCWEVLVEVLYASPQGKTSKVLAACSRAIEVKPTVQWSRLFRAYCLHDDARWEEAADAYAAVDLAFFVGSKEWRACLAREQRAFCLMMAGRREEALELFLEVIGNREQALDGGGEPGWCAPLQERPLLLAEAARTQFRVELLERVSLLLHREGEEALLVG